MKDTQRKRRLPLAVGLCLLLIAARSLPAQGLGSIFGTNKTPGSVAAPTDPLNRLTPRSSMFSFLEACHSGRYELAARYLDLSKIRVSERISEGPDLAKELADLLDRDPQFELNNLSDAPAGNTADGLTPDMETLVTASLDGQPVSLYLQRVTQQGLSTWLVSAESLDKIPQMASMDQEPAFAKKLPAWFVQTKLMDTPIWLCIALIFTWGVLILLSRLLSKLVIAISVPVARRYVKSIHTYRVESFTEPLRVLLLAVALRASMQFVAPSALLRDYLMKLLVVVFAIGVASFLMRVVDVLLDQMQSRLDARARALTYSVLPIGMRLLKISIFCVAIIFVLSGWGYNTNAILAGLGVGGLAVALAAQKTIENFFGSVSLISDRPVLVGDFCKFAGQVGTIEDIGLRSTRIRTLDRTLVTIPNAQFSTMTLENYSRRDQMWFHPTLHLRRDSTAEQVRGMMERLTTILEDHPMVSIGGVPVRFTKIDDQALDLEIFAYVKTADFDEYLKVQSELLLQIMEAAAKMGIGFAFPIQESLTGPLKL